ncbi:phosphatase PAP2 family protein [Virgibacillus xinjiangensis]|uniref:Phosphatase PAP2 family protein n=1 Tax=Virgibacillus xinjiangensis TaxID=393090 RepID=A0ABV7CWD9_9BACI
MYKRNYIFLLLLSVLLIFTGIWIVKIMTGTLPYVDQWTRGFVGVVDDTAAYTFFRWMTELGSGTFLTPLTIIMGIVIWRWYRHWVPAVIFAGGTFTSHLLNLLIKNVVDRQRPSLLPSAEAVGHSFPSGHAMIPMVCYGLLAYYLGKKIDSSRVVFVMQLTFALLVFLIGISRYFLNVHYLTDVVAGFFVGFLWLMGCASLDRWMFRRSQGAEE